MLIFSDVYIS